MTRCALLRLRWSRAVLVVLLLGSTPGIAVAAESSALEVAERLVDAFNRHDPSAMAELVADDFELYYVDDQGQAALALAGSEALEQEMAAYFAANPEVASEIRGRVDGPVYVSFREQIVGGASSLAVYEVRDGEIQRVWYYPAEP